MQSPATRNGVTVNYSFLIAFLVGLSAFGSFVNDMYLPSMPEMSRYFHCSVPTVNLGLTMGMIGLALLTALFALLSKRLPADLNN